ncbi:MAG: hypothetical protein WC205_00670 [Opitutaceae bacterium]|jgi:hypothetical protein
MTSDGSTRLSLVLLGHPGHELRIYGWLKHHRPEVWVITDGSGAVAEPRLDLSRRVLASLGLSPGALYGAHTDREIYAAILRGDAEFFRVIARAVTARLVAGGFTSIVSDASEGYNPTHDLCQLIAGAAAIRASRESGRQITHFTFLLTGHPEGEAKQRHVDDIAVNLDDTLGQEKIQAALDYARTADGTLLKEVEETLARFGAEIFRHERLLSHAAVDYEIQFGDGVPFYEKHGERRASSGLYHEVIRLRQHMVPLARALRDYGAGAG